MSLSLTTLQLIKVLISSFGLQSNHSTICVIPGAMTQVDAIKHKKTLIMSKVPLFFLLFILRGSH